MNEAGHGERLKKPESSNKNRERITLLVGRNAATRLERLHQLVAGWLDEDFNGAVHTQIPVTTSLIAPLACGLRWTV